MSEDLVLYEVVDSVSIITLNRPGKLNAISDALRQEAVVAFRRAEADEATNVVLLRANGRSFCVGYDIGGGDPSNEAWRHDALKWHDHLRECLAFEMLPWDLRKPVVASVQGHALGGGCELAMLCDITIAADNALFGEPEVRFSDTGPAIVMPWIIGLKKARELLYLGDMIDAKTALDLGMINRHDQSRRCCFGFGRRVAQVCSTIITHLPGGALCNEGCNKPRCGGRGIP
jgi:enoyl-CoA hydratase/carnithine racemase